MKAVWEKPKPQQQQRQEQYRSTVAKPNRSSTADARFRNVKPYDGTTDPVVFERQFRAQLAMLPEMNNARQVNIICWCLTGPTKTIFEGFEGGPENLEQLFEALSSSLRTQPGRVLPTRTDAPLSQSAPKLTRSVSC